MMDNCFLKILKSIKVNRKFFNLITSYDFSETTILVEDLTAKIISNDAIKINIPIIFDFFYIIDDAIISDLIDELNYTYNSDIYLIKISKDFANLKNSRRCISVVMKISGIKFKLDIYPNVNNIQIERIQKIAGEINQSSAQIPNDSHLLDEEYDNHEHVMIFVAINFLMLMFLNIITQPEVFKVYKSRLELKLNE